MFLFALAAPALSGQAGVAYFLFEPLNGGVVILACLSIAVTLEATRHQRRESRRGLLLVDLPISAILGAVAAFLTFELLVAQLSPLERNQVGTFQLFYWFACIPGGFAIAAEVLVLLRGSRWGVERPDLRWPLIAAVAGAASLPIVGSSWLYSTRETPLWPLGLVLVLVAAVSGFVVYYRPHRTPS